MPENNVPSAKPDPEVAPGEFDFAAPITERPRVKRRALQQAAPPKQVEAISEKTIEPETRPVETPVKPAAAASPTRPASSTTASTSSSTAAKPKTASTQTTSPHGTRPATLYYSSGSRQDKSTSSPAPSPSPMKTTPSAGPSSSTTSSASPTAAPRTAATTTRPSSVSDYRTNVERQSREQKSVGDVLSVLVYALMAMFVLGFSLAGYGAYVITKQLNKQSVTMSDFDKRYAADYTDVNTRLTTTQENLTQAQTQIAQQQAVIAKQQEAITKLLATLDDNTAAIKQERVTRAQETANLRTRLKDLEYQGPTTRKY